MHSVILSLGGSLLYSNSQVNHDYVRSVGELLGRQKNLGVVVGGGTKARDAADAVRSHGGGEFAADEAAIAVTHENARLLAGAIGREAVFCKDFASAARVFGKKIPVMGGVLPGLTTDAVAVLLAEKLGVRVVVNASKINGVYDKNPAAYSDAKLYEKLTHGELVALAVKSDERRAGTNFVFDLIACKLAARSRIELRFVDGRVLQDLKNALSGKKWVGTRVA